MNPQGGTLLAIEAVEREVPEAVKGAGEKL